MDTYKYQQFARESRDKIAAWIAEPTVETYSGKLQKDVYGDTSRGHYLIALVTF